MTSSATADASERTLRARALRAIFLVIPLTLTYLVFELAFNARLLDVVGGGASQEAVHNIEISGRLLSGCAAALVVLQMLLSRGKGWGVIFLACSLTIGTVYVSLQSLVDYVVDSRSLEFRRQALNVTLIQKAIVDGRVQLAGVDQDPSLFARPEGKAFLAMFSFMAASVDELDRKIAHAKLQLLSEHIGKQAGGIQGYYRSYEQAIAKVTQQWNDYKKLSRVNVDVDAETNKQHQRAWSQYLNDLGKRGWTPSSVPSQYHAQVRRSVRKQGAPVGDSWRLHDEAGFRAAIAQKVRRTAQNIKTPEVRVRGQLIPLGLSQNAFVMHPALQAELREQLKLPSSIAIPPQVDKAQFRGMYDAMRNSQASIEAQKYTAPLATFGPGGSNYEQGLDATRAAVVPPIALFFSMVGAIGHMGKLSYLFVKLLLLLRRRTPTQSSPQPHARWRRWLPDRWLAVPLVLALGIWTSLSWTHNPVTESELYATLTQATLERWQDAQAPGPASRAVAHALVNILHVVSVGQSYAYPYNESLRTQVLQGITFGYRPEVN